MLHQKGHILDCVENGKEAETNSRTIEYDVEANKSTIEYDLVTNTNTIEYDLVLMDCNMPIMDGWQVFGFGP
ncbi:hypothetical protein T484DRAFT_1786522 [Baffinella frigidus]|nr:hypothetical protein T484DRAFT_1786522 [Cryptophyta sp. CCMP2293]